MAKFSAPSILTALLVTLSLFFMVAGLNHFINPGFYLPLIPPYFPWKDWINWISGMIEIVLGLGLLFSRTRRISSWGIILLLLLFIPSHVYFIQIGSCVEDGLCVPPWAAWFRLLLVHPLLLLWAYQVKKLEK